MLHKIRPVSIQVQSNQKRNKTYSIKIQLFTYSGGSRDAQGYLIPLVRDGLVLPLPPGLEVGTKLKPEHQEMTGGHLLLSRFGLQSKVQNQVLKTEQQV